MNSAQNDSAPGGNEAHAFDSFRQQFYEVLKRLPCAAYTCDPQGQILFYNSAAGFLWGREPKTNSQEERFCGAFQLEDMYGQILSPEDSVMAQALLEKSDIKSSELVIVKPDGNKVRVMANAAAFFDKEGKIRGSVNLLFDLTEKHESDRLLMGMLAAIGPATGRDFFQALVKHITLAYNVDYAFIGEIDSDNDGMMQVLAMSYKGESIHEFSYSIEGTPCEKVLDQLTCFYPSGIKGKFPKDALLQGMDVESYLGIRLVSAQGNLGVIAMVHSQTIENPQPIEAILKIVAVRAVGEIERKRVAEQEQQFQQNLQRKSNLESLSILTGGIAHEFNNLLASIIGNTGLALRKLPKDDPVASLLHKIERAAGRSAGLTQQMLVYSGRSNMARDPIELESVVGKVVSDLSNSITSNTKIELKLEPGLVSGDKSHLSQLVTTLLSNAIDAIEDRIGKIHVSTGSLHLNAEDLHSPFISETFASGEYGFLEIQDNGKGMSPETQAHLFDPFYSTKFTGRGLGLAAALGIVKSHRGSISVQSEPGIGSTFKVYFPICKAIQASQDRKQQTTKPQREKNTVLVIDDEQDMRDLVMNILEDAGYDVILASSGQQGLDLFESNQAQISAVLLDMTMPGMNGLDVLKVLKKNAPDVPVIIMSGYCEVQVKSDLAEIGAVDFLEKPFKPDELDRQIDGAVQGKKIH